MFSFHVLPIAEAGLLALEKKTLPEKWQTLRPEQLRPEDFLTLTADIFGEVGAVNKSALFDSDGGLGGGVVVREGGEVGGGKEMFVTDRVWRQALTEQVNVFDERE